MSNLLSSPIFSSSSSSSWMYLSHEASQVICVWLMPLSSSLSLSPGWLPEWGEGGNEWQLCFEAHMSAMERKYGAVRKDSAERFNSTRRRDHHSPVTHQQSTNQHVLAPTTSAAFMERPALKPSSMYVDWFFLNWLITGIICLPHTAPRLILIFVFSSTRWLFSAVRLERELPSLGLVALKWNHQNRITLAGASRSWQSHS